MTFQKYGTLVAALGTLAACGGSSGPQTFNSVVAEVESLQDRFEAPVESDNFVSPDILPTTGTATFSGAMAFSGGRPSLDTALENSYAVSGMTVSVNLADDTVTGSADNFFRIADEAALEGSFDLDATLDRDVNIEDDFGILGSLDGTLEDINGDIGIIEMEVQADFYEADEGDNTADFIFGDALGTSRFDGSDERDSVSAIFLVESN